MEARRTVTPARLRRLADELVDDGIHVLTGWPAESLDLVLDELDYALRPPPHERRIPTYGAIVQPSVEPSEWAAPTGLTVSIRPSADRDDEEVRRYADGAASWAVRQTEGISDLAVFDRSASSERDLVVVAQATGGTVVQRDRTGAVRLVGPFGVARWEGVRWHLEPPVGSWLDMVSCAVDRCGSNVLEHVLEFAVHDLGAQHVGAVLVLRPEGDVRPGYELRLPSPPPLRVDRPSDLAPLFHVLGQVDGAAVFDGQGVLRHLGVRLVPSSSAESVVPPLRGTRHTAARRYSFDDPDAVVVVVSEEGPVSVFRGGELLGTSPDD